VCLLLKITGGASVPSSSLSSIIINNCEEREKESINNLESNKEYEIKNIYESPQRIANNNFNAISNSSTTNLNSSNRPSNIDKNVLISTKEKTNGQTDKTKLNKIGKKVNIYTMNCVKKNLMSNHLLNHKWEKGQDNLYKD